MSDQEEAAQQQLFEEAAGATVTGVQQGTPALAAKFAGASTGGASGTAMLANPTGKRAASLGSRVFGSPSVPDLFVMREGNNLALMSKLGSAEAVKVDTPGAPAICEALAPVESAGYPTEELKSLATIAVGASRRSSRTATSARRARS